VKSIGKVSVIVPVFNAEKTLHESLQSILDQTYRDIEVVAVNDCSSDGSNSVLLDFQRRFRRELIILNLDKNMGAAGARNEGIKMATGRFIAFCDADDIWLSNKLELQLSHMNSLGVACSHSSYLFCNHRMEPLKTIKAKKIVRLGDMKFANEIGNLTGLYDVSKIGKFYQSEGVGHEDYAMWIDILHQTESLGVQEVLAKYRKQANSLSSNKLKALTWHFKIVTWKFGVLSALLGMPVFILRSVCKHANFSLSSGNSAE